MSINKIFATVSSALFFVLPVFAFGATLSITPLSSSIRVGETLTVNVVVSSPGQAINAAAGAVSFPTDKLEVVSLSRSGSILTLWVQEPSFSNAAGTISFEGVVPNPGFSGSSGKIVTITFRSKSAGSANVSFSSPSILANDGEGTEILTGATGSTIAVQNALTPTQEPGATIPEGGTVAVTSPTHPDQNAWYQSHEVEFNWQNVADTTAVRLGYGLNSQGVPQVNYQPPISQRKLVFEDGVTYFSLQEKTPSGWGDIYRYRVQIDTVVPEPFTIELVPEPGNTDKVLARFQAFDKLSGIGKYDLIINGELWKSFLPPELRIDGIALPQTGVGTSTLKVIAYDKANNATSAETRYFSTAPKEETSSSGNPAFSARIARTLGILTDNILSIALFVVLALGLVAGTWYVANRPRKHTLKSSRRIAQSNKALRTEFLELHDMVKEELRVLKEMKAKRELTENEEQLIKRFNHLLTKLEKTLEKELTVSHDL